MNKNKTEQNKTLKLDVETVRNLTGDQLSNVAGGAGRRLISLSVGCNCSAAQTCGTQG